jgi:hypothetical protein
VDNSLRHTACCRHVGSKPFGHLSPNSVHCTRPQQSA